MDEQEARAAADAVVRGEHRNQEQGTNDLLNDLGIPSKNEDAEEEPETPEE